jgi:hypothetical protein
MTPEQALDHAFADFQADGVLDYISENPWDRFDDWKTVYDWDVNLTYEGEDTNIVNLCAYPIRNGKPAYDSYVWREYAVGPQWECLDTTYHGDVTLTPQVGV